MRTISAYTSRLVREAGVEPTAEFAAFMDLEPFIETGPRRSRRGRVALFVGVLERYKAVDVLADAWRLAAPRVPDATLHLVGRGTLRERARALVAELPQQVRWTESLPTPRSPRALDEATVLVLPSRSEGLGRVVVEAFCRGRGVVASRVGGIPDIVEDGETGLLVPPGDADGARGRARPCRSPIARSRSGSAPRRTPRCEPWLATPEEYARRLRELVDEVTGTPAYTHAMRADRAKQLLKNGVYRAIGETVSGAGGLDGEAERTLRVLMYHKVNDLQPNPTTVPTAVFAEQMALLGELGYVPVSLEQVRDHYVDGAPLPRGAVLITFDDGYRDNLENALPILQRHGYPGRDLRPDRLPRRRSPAAARGGSARARRSQPDASTGTSSRRSRQAASGSSRTGSATGPSPSSSRPRQRARSRSRSSGSRSGSGGRSSAYAFVKGSLADYRPEHVSLVQQAGYTLGFTSVSGANGPTSDRFRLRRYNVEPYPPRTFELVLAGACDLISVKDTVPGTYARAPSTRCSARRHDELRRLSGTRRSGGRRSSRCSPASARLSSRTRSSHGGSTAIREARESCRSPSTRGRSWGSRR